MTIHRFLRPITTVILLALSTLPAFAHHPTGGKIPETLWHGLLSGLGHPIIGIDHFAFVLAIGIIAGLLGKRFLVPLLFIGGTLAGVTAHLYRFDLPLAEVLIAATIVIAGLTIALQSAFKKGTTALFAGFGAIAGLFHGYAYGESIIGAETTPLVSYFAGLGFIQFVIAVGMATLVMSLSKDAKTPLPLRLTGAVVSALGAFFLAQAV